MLLDDQAERSWRRAAGERAGLRLSACAGHVVAYAGGGVPESGEAGSGLALIYDETDGLGFYADFGLVGEAFTNPGLLRRRRWREQALSYLEDESVEPMVLRRLADRDPEKATVVFRRLLKRPRFDWNRDGEKLMREVKPGYYDRPPRPRVSPLSERLAEFAERR
jgi:hypothetical protein